jgi:Fe-S-cluster-containing hydrogenase component 2
MLRPEIDWELCQVCNPCLAKPACRTRAVVKFDPDEPPFIEMERCNGCAKCVPACPFAAISMRNNGSQGNSVCHQGISL